MNKERLIIYILCFILLLAGFMVVIGLKDAKECLGNPFIFGANKIETENTGELHCNCAFASPNYAPFYFNNQTVEVIEQPKEYFNFTEKIAQ